MIRRLLKKIYFQIKSKGSVVEAQKPKHPVSEQPKKEDVYTPQEEASEPEAEENVEVESQEVLAWIEEGKNPILIDIRQPYELRSGFIPNAYLISMNQLAAQVDLFPKDVPIVLYCAAGARSFGMAHFMREKGFADSWSLSGGVGDWNQHEHILSSARFQLLQEVTFEGVEWIVWGARQENEQVLYRLRKKEALEIRSEIEETFIST